MCQGNGARGIWEAPIPPFLDRKPVLPPSCIPKAPARRAALGQKPPGRAWGPTNPCPVQQRTAKSNQAPVPMSLQDQGSPRSSWEPPHPVPRGSGPSRTVAPRATCRRPSARAATSTGAEGWQVWPGQQVRHGSRGHNPCKHIRTEGIPGPHTLKPQRAGGGGCQRASLTKKTQDNDPTTGRTPNWPEPPRPLRCRHHLACGLQP